MYQEKPVFGIISYFGGTWSVENQKRESEGSHITSSTSGHGDFPYEKYPGIPVIDYKGNDAVFEKLRANIGCIDTQNNSDLYKLMPLADYIKWHILRNIRVIFRDLTVYNEIRNS